MLTPEEIEAIADRVAGQLGVSRLGLVTVDQLAAELHVEKSWVYERWRQLGGYKLGTGRNSPLRFDLQRVRLLLESDGLNPTAAVTRPRTRTRTRQRGSVPEGAKLLRPRGSPE